MRKFLFLAGVLLLAGCGNDEVEVNGAVMSYEKLTEEIQSSEFKIEEANADLKAKEKELADLQETFEANKKEYESLEELRKNRDGVVSKVKDAENKLGLIEADIEEAQAELDKAKGEIVKTKDAPLKIDAGYFYFGEDVPPGRYKMMAQEGQRGNVFIRDSNGSYVADTFGEGALESFVFESFDGDEIEATIPIYLYPVE